MGKPMKIYEDGLAFADRVLENERRHPADPERHSIANAYAQGFFAALDRISAGLFVGPQTTEAKAHNVWLAEWINLVEDEAKKPTVDRG